MLGNLNRSAGFIRGSTKLDLTRKRDALDSTSLILFEEEGHHVMFTDQVEIR